MRSLATSAAVVAALLVAAPGMVHAQNNDDAALTELAKEHYKAGLAAFQAGRYNEAITELKAAYLLKKLPPLLLNIAKTYEKLGDRANAISYYQRYLAEAPPDAAGRPDAAQALAAMGAPAEPAPPQQPGNYYSQPPQPQQPGNYYNQPAQNDYYNQPNNNYYNQPAQQPPPQRQPPVRMPTAWAHTPIDSAPPGSPIDVRVQTPVMKGVQVYLYYRAPGQVEFTPVLMKRRGAEKVGRIPADATNTGTSIQYYIEAKDGGGQVVKNSGSQADPNIVMLDADAPPQFLAQNGYDQGGYDDEGEQPQQPPPVQRRNEDESPIARRAEHPLQPQQPRAKKTAEEPASFGTLGYVGFGLLGGGALIAGGLGGAGLAIAKQNSDIVTLDGNDPNCRGSVLGSPYSGKCQFYDLQIKADGQLTDWDFQQRGKAWNAIGIAAVSVGSALAVTGIALIAYDYTQHKKKAEQRTTPRRTRPRYYEQSSIRNLLIAPTLSPTSVGVGGGFNF